MKTPSEYPWSSYRYFVGEGKGPKWLTTELVLSEFGGAGKKSFRRYREYVEEGVTKEIEHPLEKVVASAFLGREWFIEGIKLKYLDEKEIDGCELPALKKILRGHF